MKVYRITRKKYIKDLSGKGAELFGGRWNMVGTPALYTSESRALAVLELLVHTPKEIIPPNYFLLEIDIPEKLEGKIITLKKLQKDWHSLQTNDQTQEIGSTYFAEDDVLGIKVPSAIIRMEYNIVLNPVHQDYKFIKITDAKEFKFDERLF